MISPYFCLSEKSREYSTKVVIFSLLVVFLELYEIPLKDIGFFTLKAEYLAKDPSHNSLKVGVIFYLIGIYYYLILLGMFLHERAVLHNSEAFKARADLIVPKSAPNTVSTETKTIDNVILQQTEGNIDSNLHRNFLTARLSSYIRLLTDIFSPTVMIILASWLQLPSTIAVIREVLYF